MDSLITYLYKGKLFPMEKLRTKTISKSKPLPFNYKAATCLDFLAMVGDFKEKVRACHYVECVKGVFCKNVFGKCWYCVTVDAVALTNRFFFFFSKSC